MYRLEVYGIDAYAAVRKMLMDYTSYAPEYAEQSNEANDIRYFEENFWETLSGSIAYILKDVAGTVEAFMTCEKGRTSSGESGWYVTNLFVRQSDVSVDVAKQAISMFSKTISDDEFLCINVNAQCKNIISLWQQLGFSISPDRTIFRNADDETIIALTKLPELSV